MADSCSYFSFLFRGPAWELDCEYWAIIVGSQVLSWWYWFFEKMFGAVIKIKNKVKNDEALQIANKRIHKKLSKLLGYSTLTMSFSVWIQSSPRALSSQLHLLPPSQCSTGSMSHSELQLALSSFHTLQSHPGRAEKEMHSGGPGVNDKSPVHQKELLLKSTGAHSMGWLWS